LSNFVESVTYDGQVRNQFLVQGFGTQNLKGCWIRRNDFQIWFFEIVFWNIKCGNGLLCLELYISGNLFWKKKFIF